MLKSGQCSSEINREFDLKEGELSFFFKLICITFKFYIFIVYWYLVCVLVKIDFRVILQ